MLDWLSQFVPVSSALLPALADSGLIGPVVSVPEQQAGRGRGDGSHLEQPRGPLEDSCTERLEDPARCPRRVRTTLITGGDKGCIGRRLRSRCGRVVIGWQWDKLSRTSGWQAREGLVRTPANEAVEGAVAK